MTGMPLRATQPLAFSGTCEHGVPAIASNSCFFLVSPVGHWGQDKWLPGLVAAGRVRSLASSQPMSEKLC
jgi:hypothetical protein